MSDVHRHTARRALVRIIRKEGSQRALARRLQVTQSAVSKWLSGETRITPRRAIALAQLHPELATRAELRPDLWG
jgi:DNA-binding transcriptional regulator YdaS (Cro superfamily)